MVESAGAGMVSRWAMLALAVLACNVAGSMQVLAGRVRGRAAPATENTMDEPDAQRLALGRLQCSCHLVKSSIKAVPMSFLSVLAQSQTRSRCRQDRNGSAESADRPDRLECSCSTKPSGARTHLPAPRKRLDEGSEADPKPASDLLLPDAH